MALHDSTYLVISELTSEVPKTRLSELWLVEYPPAAANPPQENAERCSHFVVSVSKGY